MSDPKFTPRPWHAEKHRDAPYDLYTIRNEDNHVADVNDIDADDLNLMLAAPDLYAAADEALAAVYGAIEVCGEIGNLAHARDLLISALAKARGEA